jgi:hypothetical protein
MLMAREAFPNANITLSDMGGKICKQWQNISLLQGQQITLASGELLPGGIYLLRITNEKSNSIIRLTHIGQ